MHFSLYEYLTDGTKLNAANGNLGQIDPMPFMKIRVPQNVGYRKHPEKDLLSMMSAQQLSILFDTELGKGLIIGAFFVKFVMPLKGDEI